MASLTCTPDVEWGGVLVTVDLEDRAGAYYATVRRTNPDGAQVTVRSGDMTPLPGGVTLVWDGEAPLGVPVTYTVEGYTAAGAPVGEAVTSPPVLTPSVPGVRAWVKAVHAPQLSRVLPVTVYGNFVRKRQTVEMKALGRPNKVIHSYGLGGREGDFAVAALTTTDMSAVEALLSQDRLLVQFAPNTGIGDMYCQTGDLEPKLYVSSAGRTVSTVRTRLVETDRPPTGGSVLMYPRSSYELTAMSHDSYADVADTYWSYLSWARG